MVFALNDRLQAHKHFMTATILVIDRYEVVRKALCQWLKVEFPSIRVLEAKNHSEAIACMDGHLPNLVIIDILLPGTNGVTVTKQIKSLMPLVPILILTMYEDEEYHAQVLRAGASIFIPQREMFKKLIPCIRTHLALIKVPP